MPPKVFSEQRKWGKKTVTRGKKKHHVHEGGKNYSTREKDSCWLKFQLFVSADHSFA